jgi:hypothetical protein
MARKVCDFKSAAFFLSMLPAEALNRPHRHVTLPSPFLSAVHDVVSPISGHLSIGINQSDNDTGDGSYTVHGVYAVDPTSGATLAIAKSDTAIPGIDNSLFGRIPRRIADKDGNPGDMVNFMILGPEAVMQRVFTAAGWVKVDADVKGTVLHGLIVSLSKESYLTMP